MSFAGCGTAIVTPFQHDGALDMEALRGLVEWQIDEGIDYLVACGSTGEAQTLAANERRQVVQAIVETAAGRVPVVAGATHNDTRKAMAETVAMCALGVDGILTAAPYYNKPTRAGQLAHFRAVADASTCPVILYNVPGRTAVNVTPDTILALSEHPRIAAVKEASGDLAQAMAIIAGRPEGFEVLSGEDNLTLAMIACGGDGIVSVTANEVPGLMSELARAARSGDFHRARALHFRLLPLMDANFVETNPGPVKAALAQMGKIQNVLRLPLVPVSSATEDRLRHALDAAGFMGASR